MTTPRAHHHVTALALLCLSSILPLGAAAQDAPPAEAEEVPAAEDAPPSEAEEVPAAEAPRDGDRLATPIPSRVEVEDASDLESADTEEEIGTAVVEVRRLTPVRPEPAGQAPRRAYQIYWELDLPVLGAGAALAAARIFRSGEESQRAACLFEERNGIITTKDHCDPAEVNPFDRVVAGRYNETWAMVSDLGLLSVSLAPIPLLWADEGFLPMLNDMVVVYQSGLLAVAFSGMATLTGSRARPFVYGTEAPEDVRTSGNGALSFVSSHTSFSFAIATATFWTVERRHGGDALSWATMAVGGAGASLVAVSRVLAGRHFPTDVMAGALVGISVGTLVPILHASPVQVTANVDSERAEAGVTVQF